MNIVALAGGGGGAKLAQGLTLALEGRGRLTVIVNTGDDFDWNGLRICPDLDAVTYTLGGLVNPDTGWGVAGDTFECLAALQRLGLEAWFRVGDRDLATHLRRTELLRAGQSLTAATASLTRALHIRPAILPMTDDRFRTRVETDAGVLDFQDYFVRQQWQPVIRRVIFDGADTARPTPQVSAAVARADAIIFCPSNPFVSIEPILSLLPSPVQGEGLRVAVSPIVGGQALKGPAAKMFRELGLEPSAFAVAQRYQHIITHFVLDQRDRAQDSAIQALGLTTLVTDTWMKTLDDRARLAGAILNFIQDSWRT